MDGGPHRVESEHIEDQVNDCGLCERRRRVSDAKVAMRRKRRREREEQKTYVKEGDTGGRDTERQALGDGPVEERKVGRSCKAKAAKERTRLNA